VDRFAATIPDAATYYLFKIDVPLNDSNFKYWAFVSYSHQDSSWCTWIHSALETYRIPARLVGRETRLGKVPARIYPVFRDRDELPSSAALNQNLVEALTASRYMVVICSPRAAASRWVNEEIRQFKMLGRESRILAIIVDGEPNASDKPELGLPECFPPALRFGISPDGSFTTTRTEPIAADVRPGKDSRSSALLRIVAGIIGVGYDELRQRDRARKRRNAIVAGLSAAFVVAGLAIGFHHYDVDQRINDFEERGRKELLAGQATRAAVYLSESYRLGNQSADMRFMLFQAMQDVETLAGTLSWPGEIISRAQFSADASLLEIDSYDAKALKTLSTAENAATEIHVARFVSTGGARVIKVDGFKVSLFDPNTRQVIWSRAIPDVPATTKGGYVSVSDSTRSVVVFLAGRITVFDVEDGAIQGQMTMQTPKAIATISGNGTRLLESDGDSRVLGVAPIRIVLWDVANRKQMRVFDSNRLGFAAARFSPDASHFAIARPSGEVEVYKSDSGELVVDFRDPRGVQDLIWSPDSGAIVTGSRNGNGNAWNAANGQLLASLVGHTGPIQDSGGLMFASPTRLVTASADGTIRVWDSQLGNSLAVFDAQQGNKLGVAVNWKLQQAVSYGENRDTLKIWDMSKVRPADRFVVSDQSIQQTAVDPAGTRMAFAGFADDSGQYWNLALQRRIVNLGSGETPHAFSADGATVLTELAVRSAADGRVLLDFQAAHGGAELVDASWTPHQTFALSAARDKQAFLWELPAGRKVSTVPVKESVVETALNADGTLVAMNSYYEGDTAVVDTRTGALVWPKIADPVLGSRLNIHFLRDPRRILVRAGDVARVIDLTGDKELARYELSADLTAEDPSFCRNTLLFLSSPSRTAALVSLDTGMVLQILHSPAALFDPDCDTTGRRIVTGGKDGVTRIWRLDDGELLYQFQSHQLGARTAHFVSSDARMVTAGGDGTVAIWKMGEETRAPEEVARVVACRVPWKILGRDLVASTAPSQGCN
jgi:WD40 repeat protein